MVMSKKYGMINLNTNELYDYIGVIVFCNGSLRILITKEKHFDLIKCIKTVRDTRIKNTLTVLNNEFFEGIAHFYDRYMIESLNVSFNLYFESEEEALYFKLKYCS